MTERAQALLLALVVYGVTLVWMGGSGGWSWEIAGQSMAMTMILCVLSLPALMLAAWFILNLLDLLDAVWELLTWIRKQLRL